MLDEPTSNVDIETEARIRQALDRLTAGRTVIVIAHRRSTLAGLDRIVMMEAGQIVADVDSATGLRLLDSMAAPA